MYNILKHEIIQYQKLNQTMNSAKTLYKFSHVASSTTLTEKIP